jgi:hypothetical protein
MTTTHTPGLAAVLTAATAAAGGTTDPAPVTSSPQATSPAAAPATGDVRAEVQAAVAAERSRITSLDAIALPGFEQMVADAKASGDSAGDLAVKMIGVIKSEGRLDAVAALTKASAVVPALPAATSQTGGTAATGEPALAGEAKWKADYAGSAALQAEFGSEGAYVALMRAEAAGKVKVLRGKA